ncbi:hypothetical protein DSO57_1024991 [Entomophthora muscae]|uniref:Uncharacterized protein n=1 Tax=Entomophthora muscae TaxID=34485 RepID=A0ACC2T2Q7_9FUNG|nr:hypothetical protein DSO57_1024991 [Entomophthora muscae]
MSAHNSSQPSLRQVYQDLMAGMTDKDCKAFMKMPYSSWVWFLNQLLSANSCLLRAQDCDTMVAGSERGTVMHVEGGEEVDSIFAETENLQDWSNDIVLETAFSPLATPSALLCACHNSEDQNKETLSVYVQALFAKDNTVTPIHLRAHYHSSYNVEQLIGEVDLCLHVTARDTSDFSLQHIYTITQRNQYICEVARIWALEQSANPELPCTLGPDLQANTPHCFSLALRLFVQAVKDNNLQLCLPLAVSVAHSMWYPPKGCSFGAVGFEGRCLEHFCRIAYQPKVFLPACHSYMEDVLLNCLTIGSAFSSCGGWGRLVNKKYKLVAPLVPLSASKRPCSTPSCHFIPYLPADSASSTGTSNKTPGNWSLFSGSRRCSPE